MKRKLMSYLLVLLTLINTIAPALAATTYTDSTESVEYHEHTEDYTGTTVYAEIGSEFKVTIPKKVTLDGALKSGTYNVLVEGDIAGNEYVKVVPETYFLLYTKDKAPIPATVSQDRTGWSFLDFGTKANGLIETEGMTAGAWNGTFNFNIKLESSMELDSTVNGSVTNPDDGEEAVTLKVNNVSGVQKEQLLDALEESGQIESGNDIDIMINITTSNNTLEGIDNIIINTTGVANPGDTVAVVQEKGDEWDYISTGTVTNNNEVKIPMTSTRPVSFMQTQPDGTVHVHKYEEDITTEATCSTNGTLSMMCECFKEYAFSIPASHELEQVEKKDENGELINKYYQCENCAYSILNLTQLFAGNELSHNCNNYLTNKYNTTHHWNECTICNKVIGDKITHTYSEYWTMGDSCSSANKLVHTCNCGYSYQTANTRQHKLYAQLSGNTTYHVRLCSICLSEVQEWALHTDGAGNVLNCLNPGQCKTCGANITSKHEAPLSVNNTEVKNGNCRNCGKACVNLGKSSSTVTYNGITFTATIKIHFPNAANEVSRGAARFYVAQYGVITNTTHSWDASTKILTTTFTGYYNVESQQTIVYDTNYYDAAGIYHIVPVYIVLTPEKTAPTINQVEQLGLAEKNNWSISKQLTFSGTENFCGTIKLTLKDSNGNTYLNNISVPVTNKNWTYTCTPDIEANESGKTFIVEIADNYGNKATKTFTVSKTDKKAPTINSPSETSKEWSQTKDLTFVAVDEGIGNVQIAFNNINEYVNMDKNGTTYTKGYQFSGDVYGEIMAAIYYTDAAGNVATQFIKVYNLDNTAPTISNVAVNGKQITVTANDLNNQLQMEGSGVLGYALTWTQAPPQDSDWQDSNILNISTNGTYYIWVKDAVGNISECYQVRIIL